MSKELNEGQKRFCVEFIKDYNATQAAIRAGYSESSAYSQASDLLKKPEVIGYIKDMAKKITEKTLFDKYYVLKGLMEVHERCMQKVAVMKYDFTEKDMVQVTDDQDRNVWQFDSRGANKALELLGKHLKLFIDKIEIDADEGLAELIKEARQRVRRAESNEEDGA